ncbi:MAG: TonB-dependent receptor [candidate division FCPU426 bacterium]
MKKLPPLMLMCLLTLPVYAGAAEYAGQVVNELTGEPLPKAKVASLSGESAQTDGNGRFILECANPNVVVQMPGFEEKYFILRPGEPLTLAVGLKGVYELQAVRVRAKPEAKKVLVSKQNVSQEAIKETTTTLFPDVARVVQALPGVTTNNDMSGLLYVRGGEPNEVVSVLDDMIILDPYLWGGRLTVFNPNLVENVEFYAGGYPAEANQALSALLQVKNRTGNAEKVSGFLDLSVATTDAVIEGPLGLAEGSSFIVGLRRTHYDLMVNASATGNVVYPFFYDGQAKLTLPLDTGTLNVQSLFSYEGMNLNLSEAEGYGEDHSENTRFHYAVKASNTSISYDHRWSDRLSLLTLVGLGWQDGFFTFTDPNMPSERQITQSIWQVRQVWQWVPDERHLVKAGLYALSSVVDASINSTVRTPTLAGYYVDKIETRFDLRWPVFAGFFAQDDIEILEDAVFVNPGVNGQYYSGNGQWVVSPRLAVKWKMTPEWEWHLATGLYAQHPLQAQLLDKTYGNPGLQAEEAVHYIFGCQLDLAHGFHVQAEAFYKDYFRLVVGDPDPAIRYTNAGSGKAYGLDLMVQKKLGDQWDGWLTYSYVDSERYIRDRSRAEDFGQNPDLEPIRTWYTSPSERPHTLNLIFNYEFARQWKLALSQKYLAGTPETPVAGAAYVAAIDEYVPRYGAFQSERLPAYLSTDVKVSMPFFGLNGWSAYVQVTNLFDAKNVDHYYYNDDYSRRKAMYQLPRMFMGGIRWDF